MASQKPVDAKSLEEGIEAGVHMLAKHKPFTTSYFLGNIMGRGTGTMQVIWPQQDFGESKLERGWMKWTCERPIGSEAYVAVMVPKPADAPYYAGFVQAKVSNARLKLENYGYDRIDKLALRRIPQTIGLSHLLRSALKLRDGKPGDKTDWLSLLASYVNDVESGRGRRLQGTQEERDMVVGAIMSATAVDEITIETLLKSSPLRRMVEEAFGLPSAEADSTVHCIYYVPEWFYKAARAMVKVGWAPPTLQWLDPESNQFNGAYSQGCTGGFRGFVCKPSASAEELRVFSGWMSVYNLHIPHNMINSTLVDPGPVWEKAAEKAMLQMAAIKADYPEKVRRGHGLYLCRSIPVVVRRKSGENHYFIPRIGNEVHDAYTDRRKNYAWIYTATPDGKPRSLVAKPDVAPRASQKELKTLFPETTLQRFRECVQAYRADDAKREEYIKEYGNGVVAAEEYVKDRLQGQTNEDAVQRTMEVQ